MNALMTFEDFASGTILPEPVLRRIRSAFCVLRCFAIAIVFGSYPAVGASQIVYTPEHPDVKALADAGVRFLNTTRSSEALQFRTLASLAIVEHGKRYDGRVPKENAVVSATCASIVAGVDGIIQNEGEMYYPCLAIILLAETDAQAYSAEIKKLLRFVESRQEPNGSFTYKRETNTCDTSQTQFAALAMFVAKHHGFNLDVQMAKRTLQWILGSQQPSGNWVYKLQASGSPQDPGKADKVLSATLSMHAAGLSTAYLLSDFLQLNKRAKVMSKALTKNQIGLPKTVSIYVEPVEGEDTTLQKSGPLVPFDRASIANATRAGNAYLENFFQVDVAQWNNYYLYALERYAYFREQAEGDVGDGKVATWYDQSVEYLKKTLEETGSFKSDIRESPLVATSFGVLVLVRSSEVITSLPATSTAIGGEGFKTDAVLREGKNGVIRQVEAEKNLSDLLEMMKEGEASQSQLQDLADSLKKQIVEFRQKDDKSRGEIKAFLQSMISARNYFRRLIAVRFLAGEQDMDNVPALIYALGDPDLRICLEAHDGLRLISRKIDSMAVTPLTRENARRDPGVLKADEENGCRVEFDSMKRRWTDWFLKIRPGAELLD